MGLLNPGNLVYLSSLAVLVAIYLRARAKPTVEVSSLMLFEESAAPVAKSRVLRTDLLFWLEMAALAALAMALAGLYIRTARPALHHMRRALVFDLGAGMGARDGSRTRMDDARREALRIVSAASPGDSFSVIGYALEARLLHAQSANLSEVRHVIESLEPTALPARAAAMSAALTRARGVSAIDIFADRAAEGGALGAAGRNVRVRFHQVGSPDANLAIVALASGTVAASRGHVLVHNFSDHPQFCKVAVDVGGRTILDTTIPLEPNGQGVVPFGPIKHGGVVNARILSADSLAADNSRWAYAPDDRPDKVLVLSPDPDARDDLARVLLAVNRNLIVTAADPATFRVAGSPHYRLAVFNDAYDPGVDAAARLVVYPPPWLENAAPPPDHLPVASTVTMAEMQEGDSGGQLNAPLKLSPARVLRLPQWMNVVARGTEPGGSVSFPLAAFGYGAQGAMGMIAFSVHDHLLLNPDKLAALLLTVDMVKRLLAPQNLQVVATGDSVSVPARGAAKILAPDGTITKVKADAMGRVRLRPVEAGRYEVESAAGKALVYANYFDAAESNLSASPKASTYHTPVTYGATEAGEASGHASRIIPLLLWLVGLALAALLVESALLTRRSLAWRSTRHV